MAVREYDHVACGLRSIQQEYAEIVTLSLVCRYLPKYRQTRLNQISDIRQNQRTKTRCPALHDEPVKPISTLLVDECE